MTSSTSGRVLQPSGICSAGGASRGTPGESGYHRIEHDSYFTLDASWVIPALLGQIILRGPTFEPAAGMGHLIDALAACGHRALGSDLYDHGHGRVDIQTGVDLFSLATSDLNGFGSIIANLPYACLDAATAHILRIAQPLGLQICSLVRAEWPSAKSRSNLIHNNPFFDCLVVLTKRPRWSFERKASPRHYFAWVVWDFARDVTQQPKVSFAS